jgi:hypothetical protein
MSDSREIGSPTAVVNLHMAVLEERAAEKPPFSGLFALVPEEMRGSHSTRGPHHDMLSVPL